MSILNHKRSTARRLSKFRKKRIPYMIYPLSQNGELYYYVEHLDLWSDKIVRGCSSDHYYVRRGFKDCSIYSIKSAYRKIQSWDVPIGTIFRVCSPWVGVKTVHIKKV